MSFFKRDQNNKQRKRLVIGLLLAWVILPVLYIVTIIEYDIINTTTMLGALIQVGFLAFLTGFGFGFLEGFTSGTNDASDRQKLPPPRRFGAPSSSNREFGSGVRPNTTTRTNPFSRGNTSGSRFGRRFTEDTTTDDDKPALPPRRGFLRRATDDDSDTDSRSPFQRNSRSGRRGGFLDDNDNNRESYNSMDSPFGFVSKGSSRQQNTSEKWKPKYPELASECYVLLCMDRKTDRTWVEHYITGEIIIEWNKKPEDLEKTFMDMALGNRWNAQPNKTSGGILHYRTQNNPISQPKDDDDAETDKKDQDD